MFGLKQKSSHQTRFTYWACPFCGIIIPDYRYEWGSLETRVRNHLIKFHYSKVGSSNIYEIINNLSKQYPVKHSE